MLFIVMQMCECEFCVRCCTLNLLNDLLSMILIVMNGVYAIWGWLIPSSNARTVWKTYAEQLQIYINLVTYSDSLLVPMKVVTMILIKWAVCNCKHENPSDDPIRNNRCNCYADNHDKSMQMINSNNHHHNNAQFK